MSKSSLFKIHLNLRERQSFHCKRKEEKSFLSESPDYPLMFKYAVCLTLSFLYFFFFALLQDEKFDKPQGPSMTDLVLAEDVDILPYIAWQQYPGDDKKQELVRHASFSVMSRG